VIGYYLTITADNVRWFFSGMQHVPGIDEFIGTAPKSGGLGVALWRLASEVSVDISKFGSVV